MDMKATIEQLTQNVSQKLAGPLGTVRQSFAPYWQQLSPREQGLAGLGLAAVLLWLIWQLFFVSLSERQVLAERAVSASQRELQEVQNQAAIIRQLRASGSAAAGNASNQPMDAVVHSLANRYRLTIERVGYRGNLLDVEVAPARFDNLINWLVALEQQQRITVRSIRLNATDTSGVVDVREIQLERQ